MQIKRGRKNPLAYAVRTHSIVSASSGRHFVGGNQVHRLGTGDTGDAATPLEVAGQVNHHLHHNALISTRPTSRCHPRSWRKRRQHHQVVSTFLSHTSIPKNVCTISTCCASGLSTPCTWEPSTSTNPCCQPFPGDTPSPSAGRERQENIWTPCRKRRHRTPAGQSPPRAAVADNVATLSVDTLFMGLKCIDLSM